MALSRLGSFLLGLEDEEVVSENVRNRFRSVRTRLHGRGFGGAAALTVASVRVTR